MQIISTRRKELVHKAALYTKGKQTTIFVTFNPNIYVIVEIITLNLQANKKIKLNGLI